MPKKQFTLSKPERLYLQNRIDLLFTKGESFVSYPLRVVYVVRQKAQEEPRIAILASVSKKKFKRAVKRNRIKRLIRESYRLNKHLFNTISLAPDQSIDIAFLYLKNELSEYSEIEKAILKTANILAEKISAESISDETHT